MIFDLESDHLELDKVSKIHVLAYKKPNQEVKYTHDYDEMRKILLSTNLLIGHNITLYDIPVIEKILGIEIKCRLIDTLSLSWYLDPFRKIHGLEKYGEEFGVPKPKIDDWENLTPEEYAHRCIEDVKINNKLWLKLKTKLTNLYDTKESADRLLRYLEFKMYCASLQQKSKWHLDRELAASTLTQLEIDIEAKTKELASHMPEVVKYRKATRPAKPFKKDGTRSATGVKWFKLLKDNGLPEDYDGEVDVVLRVEEPNPSSTDQVKAWLFSLGWEPASYKFTKDKDDNEKQIPQVRVDGEDGKELCPSVLLLAEKQPAVKVLEGLSVLSHRASTLKGFLDNADKNDDLIASIGGLTNTLRFKHRVLVNLPGVGKQYGPEIRGSLVAREGYELCGSDMCSLEETTKKHYMFKFDPEFVEEMSKPDFDAHLDLAKHAGAVTQEEIDIRNQVKSDLKAGKRVEDSHLLVQTKVEITRKIYKAANYACVYGVGAAKLARETGLKKGEAKNLIDMYWSRNKAVKQACDEIEIKHIGKEMWLLNPVSKLYYSLRNMKDVFSTLNQGTGVYCFDRWVMEILKYREQLTAQFHDEIVLEIKKGARKKCEALLKQSIQKVNEELKLNVLLDVDVQFGNTYADIH